MKLILPEDILKQHIAFLGKTGSGKSSALRYIMEHLLAENKRVCVIDPKGDHWGIKSSADGKTAGLPVIAFGDFKESAAQDILEERKKMLLKLKADTGRILGQIKTLASEKVSVNLDVKHNEPFTVERPRRARPPLAISSGNGEPLGKCALRILQAAVQRLPNKSSRSQLAILSEYSLTSSGFTNSLSALRVGGYITGYGDDIEVTQGGIDAAGEVQPLPEGHKLLEHWCGKLGLCERTLLKLIYEAGHHGISKEELATQADYRITSSGFANSLSKLRTLELIKRGEPIIIGDMFL